MTAEPRFRLPWGRSRGKARVPRLPDAGVPDQREDVPGSLSVLAGVTAAADKLADSPTEVLSVSQPVAEVRTCASESVEPAVRHAALLVEADPLHAMVLARKLKACGFEVETADTAGGAANAFRRTSFGVVMIDCDSPGIDGFAIAAALRGLEGDAGRTPLIAVTGETSSQSRARRKLAGFDNYLERPVGQDKLNVILERYLPASIARSQAHFVDIDKAGLTRLCGMGTDGERFLRQFVTVFLSRAQQLINLMRRAVEDSGARQLAQYALALKSLSCEVGAVRMQEICSAISTLASSSALSGMEAQLAALSLALERVAGDLRGAEEEFLRDIAAESGVRSAARLTAPSNQPRRASRILVAEGNPLFARFLTTSLSAAGYEVYQAPSGREALQLFRGKAMDLAILDANMPEGNGFFVLSELRTDPQLQNLPVMILSERNREQEVLRAFEAGADDYVPKPFSPLEVTARVRRLLRRV